MKTSIIGWLFAAAVTSIYCAAAFAAGVQPDSESVRRPPPAVYMGIELLKSTEQDLFAKLSPAQATALSRDLNEVNEGLLLCVVARHFRSLPSLCRRV